MRASGILLPIFSLPSEDGIGDLCEEAYRFVDRLSAAGQSFWQVLPIGPVNKEFCPYQSSSSFAGEPLLISMKRLREKGLIDDTYEHSIEGKRKGLKTAFLAFRAKIKADEEAELHFRAFCRMEEDWLADYALFSSLSDHFGTGDWSKWDRDIKDKSPQAIAAWREKLSDEIDYYCWTQYEFFDEWDRLRKYAQSRNIELIGDIPYYTAFESADCWGDPQLFQLDEERRPVFEAGAPPDAFTAEGQCWGNPVYDWNAHREQRYAWWIRRIRQQFRFFDIVRLDHMRGFESYYVIPVETEDPRDGHWEKGPGMELFRAIEESLGKCRFIAEDLGYLTEDVRAMMAEAGYPGMKILQFAFDTSEENVYLPMNYDTDNSVIYTGTHDNDTTLGWYKKAEEWKQRFVSWYLRVKADIPQQRKAELFGEMAAPDEILDARAAVTGLIELACSSRCGLCIIPMQDYLLLGSEARVNVPGIAKGNWRWQMDQDAFNEKLAAAIREATARYGRS